MAQNLKETTVGQIPIDWDAATVADVARITTGSRNTQDKVEDGQFPFFVRSQTVERINSFSFDGEAVLTAGDGVGTGKVFHYINGPFDCHQRVYRISDFTDRMNGFYFFKYFSASFYDRIMSMTAKSSVDSVRREMIADMALPVPPIGEQNAIAAALKDIDDLIASLDALIAKKRDIKQAAMQQLLTGKTRLAGFAGEWKSAPLSQISEFITKGATPTTYGFGWQSDGILFLRSECVAQDGLDLSQSMFISEEANRVLRRSEVRSGDILMTITGNVGRVVLLRLSVPSANINQHIARIRIRAESAFAPFIFHHLTQRCVREHFCSIVTGQAYPQISLKQVRDAAIPLPSLPEQMAIASVLTDMDDDIELIEEKLEKVKQVKGGMMQQLLTGRIRLV